MAGGPEFERTRIRRELRRRLFGDDDGPVTLGRYEIVDRIAAGGTSLVYRAHDPELDRAVAVKLVSRSPDDEARSADLRERLLKEGRALARLSHPNLVSVFDIGVDGDDVFLVVELVEGETLADWCVRAPRPWREVLDVLGAAGSGLAVAHEVGLVHRDIKPANILLDERGSPRVADFGLARATTEDSGPQLRADVDSEVTAAVGTPPYMAPEQWDGLEVDARTDEYSFCVTLYEALHGRRPFVAGSLAELRAAVSAGAVADPPDDTDVPTWLHAIVVRGLSASPDARYPTLQALLDDVRRHRESTRLVDAAQLTIARMGEASDPRKAAARARLDLEAALRAWAENPAALAALPALITSMVEAAIERGDLDEARALLDEVAEGKAELEARVAEIERGRRDKGARLAELEHELDSGVADRFKAMSVFYTGLVWTAFYTTFAVLARLDIYRVGVLGLAGMYALFALITLPAALGWPRPYDSNLVNKRMTFLAALSNVGLVFAMLAAWGLDVSVPAALAFAHVHAASVWLFATMAWDRRALVLPPFNLAGALLIALAPELALEISAFVVFVATTAFAALYHRGAVQA